MQVTARTNIQFYQYNKKRRDQSPTLYYLIIVIVERFAAFMPEILRFNTYAYSTRKIMRNTIPPNSDTGKWILILPS